MTAAYDLVLRLEGWHGGEPGRHRGERDVGREAAGGLSAISTASEALGRQSPQQMRSTVTGLHVLPGVIDSQVHFREPWYDA